MGDVLYTLRVPKPFKVVGHLYKISWTQFYIKVMCASTAYDDYWYWTSVIVIGCWYWNTVVVIGNILKLDIYIYTHTHTIFLSHYKKNIVCLYSLRKMTKKNILFLSSPH